MLGRRIAATILLVGRRSDRFVPACSSAATDVGLRVAPRGATHSAWPFRAYSSSSGGDDQGGPEKPPAPSKETALVEKEDEFFGAMAPIQIPDHFPNVPIVAINRYPLFPGFIKKVDIASETGLMELLRQKVKMRQPYVGVFVKKSDEDSAEAVSSLSQLYNVGSFAQILEMRDNETFVELVLNAHRRIRLLEPIFDSSELHRPFSKPNGRRANLAARRAALESGDKGKRSKGVGLLAGAAGNDISSKDDLNGTAEAPSAAERKIIFARTENVIIEPIEKDEQTKASMQAIVQSIREIIGLSHLFEQQLHLILHPSHRVAENPVYLCDLVATIVHSAETAELQQMMQESSVKRRLELALVLLEKEKTIAKLKHQISKDVEKKVQDQHRKYLLNEQLKAIKKELGIEKDDKTSILDKMEERLKKLQVPEQVMSVIKEEQTKLGFLDPHSSEFSVSRNYLDWLTNIPWGITSEESTDLKRAAEILDRDHYMFIELQGMKDVKERILEFIAVGILKKKVSGKILCLYGPPGVGKTSIAKSIAKALNREYYRFSVGGMSDVAEIKGHRRTYVGSMPGKIIQCLKKVQTDNPLVLIDEVDKLGRMSWHGDPSAALLELLDPEQNANFMDYFLDVPVDLSKVLFICTANQTDTIPKPLQDRMELIEVSGYVAEEKIRIADDYLIPQCRETCALNDAQLVIKDDAIDQLIRFYCRESGVRNLQKQIEKIFRKVAFKIAGRSEGDEESGQELPLVVEASNLVSYVGREKFTSDRLYEVTPVGVIMGLAWTSMGGTALYVEASLSRRLRPQGNAGEEKGDAQKEQGNLESTGHLGDVMKESMRTAYTVAKTILAQKVPENDVLERGHVHVHVPEGATPKDGPSAGCVITSALISLALDRPATQNVAMTGEISLTGKVLPIGGVREKVIAAKRAGVNSVILPEENRKDYDELPDFLRSDMNIHFVKHYDEIYELLFPHSA